MILKSFRVTEFRSVKDSGWIDAESITALIGTNESGKTNILLPLWKLNPADEGKHPGRGAGSDHGGQDGEGNGEVGVREIAFR